MKWGGASEKECESPYHQGKHTQALSGLQKEKRTEKEELQLEKWASSPM